MMDDVKMMMMSFEYRKAVDIETVRNLLVESVEAYLSDINENTEIRPYLHNYPFTAKNVEIEIVFRNPDRSKVAPQEINIASATEGRMKYYVDDPERHTLKAIHKETYEEALKVVSGQ